MEKSAGKKKEKQNHFGSNLGSQIAFKLFGKGIDANAQANTSFASDDKWPNHDDTFEFVPNPDISRRPKQAFYVQIKGTRNYTEREGAIKYTLKSLAIIKEKLKQDKNT